MVGRTAAERGREARQKLLRAACEVIPEVGWHAVTTRLLAQRAGVTPGLVHYHFQSVQALLREAAVNVMRQALDATRPVLDDTRTPAAGLDMMLASLDVYAGSDPTSLLVVETYLAATRDEILRREITGLLNEFRGVVAAWLGEHGQNTPDETASVLAAAIDGVLLHRALDPDLTSQAVAPVLGRLLGRQVGKA